MKQVFFSSPIGLVRIMVENGHVTHLEFTDEETQADGSYIAEAQACPCVDGEDERVAMEALRQLGQYFKGERRDFDLPLCPLGTDFQRRAWLVLRQIPYGETVSYGEQARRMGCPKGARAVGGANHCNPLPILIPCHRVVAVHGLGGYGEGIERKKYLLRLEGALPKED